MACCGTDQGVAAQQRLGIGQRVATQIKVKDSITEQKPTVMIGADVPQEGIESGKPEKGKLAAAGARW